MEGDFNEVLQDNEKLGGRTINYNNTNLFWNCLNKCRMVDLGVKGCKFTWSHDRYKAEGNLS